MEKYDLIIIGGGPAGYSAGIYAARFNLKTLIITKLKGGLITQTHLIENYPGFSSITGEDLAQKLEEHVKYNNINIENDSVNFVKKEVNKFIIKTDLLEKELEARSIIIATGTKHKNLNVKGEKEFTGKGVSYCATCDGNFFKNKIVGIVGGGNSAMVEAIMLANIAKKVYVFVRSEIKAEPINIQNLEKFDNVEIILGVNIEEIYGDKLVQGVILSKKHKESNKVELNGLFISIGHKPQNDIAKDLEVEIDDLGEIIIDKYGRTNVEGVFAAGDVVNFEWKQAIIASSQGSICAYSAYNYVTKHFSSTLKTKDV